MQLKTRVVSFGKFLLLAGALAGTFLLFAAIAMRVAITARQVTVPDLVGRSIADATALSTQLDLQLRVDETPRPDPKVPAGHVLGQEPTAGSAARRQRSLRVWVSSGAHVALAPSLLGESQRTAEIRVAQDGLRIGTVSEIRSGACRNPARWLRVERTPHRATRRRGSGWFRSRSKGNWCQNSPGH